jgi:hypothetical protein
MKQALIFSDSHGRIDKALEIVKQYPNAEAIFHCGDIEGDADRLRQCTPHPVAIVRGNCDYISSLPQEIVTVFAGKKIAMCHGHRQVIYGGVDILKYWAMEKEADIVLFGHTHVPYVEQTSTLTVINPGSISKPRQEGHRPSYAVLEIDDAGISVDIKYCND